MMFKLKINLLLTAILFATMIFAQQGDGGNPNGFSYVLKQNKAINAKHFAQPDVNRLRAEDKINDSLRTGPWRFGFNHETSLNLNNAGTWFTTTNGDRIWILKIVADEAKTINLTFENTTIPQNAELYVYNKDKSFILGTFNQNHLYEGQLGTELVPGEVVYVEYFVPVENGNNIGNVEVSRVTHGYRTATEYQEKAFGSSGSCNMNVSCPDADNWQDQVNAAVMLVSGSNGFCSGSLINNTLDDGTPYVLTANHCYVPNSNTANWVFRFKWQSETCNNPSSSPSFESLSGAVLRARRAPSDMCLVEITGGLSNGTVPQSHTPFFAGWNRANAAPSTSVSIHHPSGDIKKIAFDDDPAQAVMAMGSSEPNSSWQVQWDRNTTTEGGSSGSPLYDQNKRIIGQLWGGSASCSNLNGPDYYGRVFNSWNPNGSTNSEQLEHWLDPNGSGVTAIDGVDPYNNPLDYDVVLESIDGADGIICGEVAYPTVNITNMGALTLTTLDINYTYNGTQQTLNWTGNLPTLQSEIVALPNVAAINGANSVLVTLANPNGQTDQNASNNNSGSNFTAVIEGESFNMELVMDCFAEETSWRVEDGQGTVWYAGQDYTNPGNATLTINETFCLLEGCYDLILEDTYGDGLGGSQWNNCNFDGSMVLTRSSNGVTAAELLEADADFGSSISYEFCAQDNASLDHFSNGNVSLYPNPSNGSFTLSVQAVGNKTVRLTDLSGKLIKEVTTTEQNIQFHEHTVSSGVYLVNVSNEFGSVTKKLIIE
jgi:hypothetical protein